MGDVGRWYGGGTPPKAIKQFWVDGTVPWLSPKDMVVDSISATEDHISEAALEHGAAKRVPAGSVAIVVRSNILRRRMPTAYVPIEITLNQDMRAVVPHDNVMARYLAFVVLAREEQIRSHSVRTDGSMAAIESQRLHSYEVPVPPLDEQRRIVDILDKFDALVNDLSAGLPAEIRARRQQYETYRDRLLSFEEAAS